ncbi:MAG: diaminopimelate epimerase [Clostridiales bacterium]|nr:diaminopimelate epimerase [Clostridiales bacterium]
MAGNALRCVGKYLYESGRAPRTDLTIQTGAGLRRMTLYVRDDVVFSASVDMGKPEFTPEKVPVNLPGDEVVDREVTLAGRLVRITCLSMGNPHAVLFCPDVDREEVATWGPRAERDPLFPKRVNVSFVTPVDRRTFKMRVWERGIGETSACGTGACAAAVAAVRLGLAEPDTDLTMRLRGGDLVVRYDGERVIMLGDAEKDFEGTIEV